MKLPRKAWKGPAALAARLEKARLQLQREEAAESAKHRAATVSWFCGRTLALARSIGCGQPEATPSPVATAPPTQTATPAPSASPSATPEPSPLATPQRAPLLRDPMVNPLDDRANPRMRLPKRAGPPAPVYGAPRRNRDR